MIAVRILDADEKLDAWNLIRETLRESNPTGSEEGKKSLLSFLTSESTADLICLGAVDRDLRGILAYDSASFHLSLFFVRPEDQKKGIGTQLMQEYLKRAEKEGIARVTVNAAEKAVPVYQKFGFETYDQKKEKDGIAYLPMECLLQKKVLGTQVKVTVDRPYGSMHPHYPDLIYSLNYGYVEQSMAADGEFQDAYIYGIKEPLETFTGIVIAIIYRRDDCESKWVVAADTEFKKQDVINAVGFQEQYFETRFVWLKKK